MSDKLTEKLFPRHFVQERVRRLEDKAPDMSSYSMFTQMNNIVNYQAKQITELESKLASSEVEQTEIMYALRVKGKKDLICRADTVKAFERMIDRMYHSKKGMIPKGQPELTFEEFMNNKEKLEIHIKPF